MIDLLKLHIFLLIKPSSSIEKYIFNFPEKMGFFVFFFYLLENYIHAPMSNKYLSTLLFINYGIEDLRISVLIFIILSLYVCFIYYSIIPIIIKTIFKLNTKEIEIIKKVILFSPTAFVIFTIAIFLPYEILPKFIPGLKNVENIYNWIYTVIVIWQSILIINVVVMQFKGLIKYSGLNVFKTIIVLIILPSILSIPVVYFFI
jgi:hypothetical protein